MTRLSHPSFVDETSFNPSSFALVGRSVKGVRFRPSSTPEWLFPNKPELRAYCETKEAGELSPYPRLVHHRTTPGRAVTAHAEEAGQAGLPLSYSQERERERMQPRVSRIFPLVQVDVHLDNGRRVQSHLPMQRRTTQRGRGRHALCQGTADGLGTRAASGVGRSAIQEVCSQRTSATTSEFRHNHAAPHDRSGFSDRTETVLCSQGPELLGMTCSQVRNLSVNWTTMWQGWM